MEEAREGFSVQVIDRLIPDGMNGMAKPEAACIPGAVLIYPDDVVRPGVLEGRFQECLAAREMYSEPPLLIALEMQGP